MGHPTAEEPPPKSTDLEGWRRAVETGQYIVYRLEDVVAAIQDLGPRTDKAVLNPLAKHLSTALQYILRPLVSVRYPNKGNDIIDRVHDQIIDAVLHPKSADGKALRTAFVPRVTFRLKDALVTHARTARNTAKLAAESSAQGEDGHHLLTMVEDPSIAAAERIDVERILEEVPDDQKRLAFRLFMDGVPFKSTKGISIAEALGISERTARTWVHEVRQLLSSLPEVQELQKLKAGGTP